VSFAFSTTNSIWSLKEEEHQNQDNNVTIIGSNEKKKWGNL